MFVKNSVLFEMSCAVHILNHIIICISWMFTRQSGRLLQASITPVKITGVIMLHLRYSVLIQLQSLEQDLLRCGRQPNRPQTLMGEIK